MCKGKANKKYEFGCKASFVGTHKEGLLLDAQALSGLPYDGHTLKEALCRAEKFSGTMINETFVDKGYRGHGVKDKKVWVYINTNGEVLKNMTFNNLELFK